jgi:hypothetical protein
VVEAATEMQEQISVCARVFPRLIRHGAVDEWSKSYRWLPVADVDDAPVVELHAAGAIGIEPPIESTTDGQGKVEPGVLKPPVVLPQPFSLGPEFQTIPIVPEVGKCQRQRLAPQSHQVCDT